MRTINSIDFKDKKALVRVDFNFPLNDKLEITDDTRIKAALPTINYILDQGGSVILMSHLGRPKGVDEKFSLNHIVKHLSKLLNRPVIFADDCIGAETEAKAAQLKPGEVMLLENLRFHPEEKAGDADFVKKLASLADVYVNDAFGTAHRAHASTAVIAQFFPHEKYFGLLLEKELAGIDKVLHQSQKPVTAIIGGAKVSSKIGIIENLLPRIDNLIIGGGMTFTFIKALGGTIGDSLVENDFLDMARSVLLKADAQNVMVYLAEDSIVADAFSNTANTKIVNTKEISEGWMGLDIGPKAIAKFSEVIRDSKTILLNGPMGVFEMPAFEKGTQKLIDAIAESTANGAFSLIGGGDSVAAVNQFGMADKVSYVSTGGGAMLEALEGKELPGVKAIND
jgi:phosphoglycerate kinase